MGEQLIKKALIIALLTLVASPASEAQYIPPGEAKVQTSVYTPSTTTFPEGIYHYRVAWQGIPVAHATVAVGKTSLTEQPYYRVTAEAQTVRAIDLFYRLRHRSEGFFRSDTFKPLSYYFVQRENSKEKFRQIYFGNDGRIRAKRWKDGEETGDYDFRTDNLTLDPLSAAFLARSLPVTLGTEATFDVFNGKNRYLITFRVEDKKPLKLSRATEFEDAVVRDAYKVVPTIKKLTEADGKEKKFKSAIIWLSADERRDILMIESEVMVGSVTAKLEEFSATPLQQATPISPTRTLLSQTPDFDAILN